MAATQAVSRLVPFGRPGRITPIDTLPLNAPVALVREVATLGTWATSPESVAASIYAASDVLANPGSLQRGRAPRPVQEGRSRTRSASGAGDLLYSAQGRPTMRRWNSLAAPCGSSDPASASRLAGLCSTTSSLTRRARWWMPCTRTRRGLSIRGRPTRSRPRRCVLSSGSTGPCPVAPVTSASGQTRKRFSTTWMPPRREDRRTPTSQRDK